MPSSANLALLFALNLRLSSAACLLAVLRPASLLYMGVLTFPVLKVGGASGPQKTGAAGPRTAGRPTPKLPHGSWSQNPSVKRGAPCCGGGSRRAAPARLPAVTSWHIQVLDDRHRRRPPELARHGGLARACGARGLHFLCPFWPAATDRSGAQGAGAAARGAMQKEDAYGILATSGTSDYVAAGPDSWHLACGRSSPN